MEPNPQANISETDDQFVELLARYDERLAGGDIRPWQTDTLLISQELSHRLAKAQSFLNLIEQAWPRSRDGQSPTAAGWTAAATEADSVEPSDASMLGRFHLLRQAGHGGGGLVFQALDTVTGRHVALKVPRPEALVTLELKERFLREARAAAVLAHPNITAVYEAGQIGAICYIASAWCDGSNLAQWLVDQQGPVPLRTAATIVAQLADAVQHAHSRGVLHRDIKPANVLLEPRGDETAPADCIGSLDALDFTPKLTDFGLAKLLETEGDPTRSGVLLGTPAYMAPEQVDGQRARIGPATDVHALGVLLYELLTGSVPHRGRGEADTLRRLVEEPAADPRRQRSEIDRDLSAIVLKCLEHEPAHRYDSAAAVRDDLRRYLAGEPVMARPVPTSVRLWRWSRRRPVIAAMSAALSLASIAGTGGIAWQWQRAERNQRRSMETLAQAHRIINHLYPIGDHIAWDVRDPQFQDNLKQQFLRLYEELLTIQSKDPLVARELADTHGRYAALLDSVGRRSEAKVAFEQAIDRWRSLYRRDPESRDVARGLAEALVLAARTLRITGDQHAAWALLVESEALLERLLAETPDDSVLGRDLASCLLWQGKVKHRLGETHVAIDLLLRATAVSEQLAEDEPMDLSCRHRLFNVLDDLIYALCAVDRTDEALRKCTQVMEEVARLEQDFPDLGGFDGSVAMCTRAAGHCWEQQAHFSEAIAAYEVTVRHYEAKRHRERDRFSDDDLLASSLLSIARIARRIDQSQHGDEQLSRALDIAVEVASNPDHASYNPRKLCILLARLAREFLQCGRDEDVQLALRLENTLRDQAGLDASVMLAEGDSEYGSLYFTLGDLAADRRDDASELQYYTLAAEAYEPLLREQGVKRLYHIRAAEARYWCGHTYRELGQWQQAQESYNAAIETIDRFLQESPEDRYAQGLLARAHHFQAQVFEALHDSSRAAPHHQSAVELFETLLVDDDSTETGFIECLEKSRQALAQ